MKEEQFDQIMAAFAAMNTQLTRIANAAEFSSWTESRKGVGIQFTTDYILEILMKELKEDPEWKHNNESMRSTANIVQRILEKEHRDSFNRTEKKIAA